MAQKNNHKQTVFIETLDQYFKLLSDETIEIESIVEVSKTKIQICYKKLEECVEPHSAYNPILAAFCCAYGRLRLFYFLKLLGLRALYSDTDE